MQEKESKSPTANNTGNKQSPEKWFHIKRIDCIVIIICLLGTGISGFAFWQEYNNTLVRLDEEPIGTIIFQRRVAQRRFIDRNVWDRLQLASPVYNGDIIRTIERSEAIIIIKDEITRLSLDERTMIQVFYDRRIGTKIDFSGGNLEVLSENNEIMITSGDSTITVSGQARMDKYEGDFILAVLDGLATFNGEGIAKGGILAIDSSGEVNTKPIIAMTSFGPSAHVLGSQIEAVPVVFSWNSANFEADTNVFVEIASDRNFNNILETRNVSGVSSLYIYMESGYYWWRVFPANAGSKEPVSRFFPSGSLEVIPIAAPHLRSPSNGEELIFRRNPIIPLSWSIVEGAFAYLVEISAFADMSNPIVSRQVEENSVVQINLDFNCWYWRITPVFPSMFTGVGISSAIGNFTITQGSPPVAEPVLTFPQQNGVITQRPLTPAARRGNHLQWVHDQNADFWLVELADNPDMLNPVIRQNTYTNFFNVPPDLLQEGRTWFWRITALGGESPAVSAVQNFAVSSENVPELRAVLSAIPPPALRPPRPVIPPPPERIDLIRYLPPIIFGANIDNWNDLPHERRNSNDQILSDVTLLLNTHSNLRLIVEGHANPVINPSNIAASNQEHALALQPLSEMRARAVVNRFVELGVDAERLEYIGRGGEEPVAAWEDVNNWWRNRRVVFVQAE